MDSSFISQGSYCTWDDNADDVVETPEGGYPVTRDTTAHMGQRVNSDNMEATGAEAKEAEIANPVKLSRKRKRNPTVTVSGVEHVTILATEWRRMTQLVGEMATLKKRVNVLETEVKRKQQEEASTKPAKKKKWRSLFQCV
jgi:chemotaxis protein histidine kinase CheA